MKKLALLLILSLSLSLGTACKKKEKEPEPTMLERLTAKPWFVSSVKDYVNGALDDTMTFNNLKIDFKEDNTYNMYDNGTLVESGTYTLDDSKNPPEIIYDGDSYNIVVFTDTEMKWEYEIQNQGNTYRQEVEFER